MGTTRTAMLAGSVRTIRTLAIEGYADVITDGSTSAVVTAFSGTDFTSAIGGLYAEYEDSQQLHPYEPFGSGGRCVIRVAPDAADTFGKATHRRIGVETVLTATIDRAATTIPVAATAAFASSGTIYIGTEAITYSGKTDTSFTGCTRGVCSPIFTDNATRFAHDHRVVTDPQSALIRPVVSTLPRTWVGRWAVLREHRVVGGVVDTIAEAEIVFAGKIVDLSDDGQYTLLELKHVLDCVKEGAVGRSLFTATVKEGIYLFRNAAFRIRESDGGTTFSTGSTLTVSDTPSGANQIASGYYTAEDICSALSSWAATARVATDLDGIYSFFVSAPSPTQEERTVITHKLAGTLPVVVIEMPDIVIQFLGFDAAQFPEVSGGGITGHFVRLLSSGSTTQQYVSANRPLRSFVDKFSNTNLGSGDDGGLRFEVEEERGSFVSQVESMPEVLRLGLSSASTPPFEGREWGLFLFDEKILIRAAYRESTHEILRGVPVPGGFGSSETLTAAELEAYTIPRDDENRSVTIRQIVVMEAPIAAMLQLLLYSTGTLAHNHTTLDNLPFGIGLGIPGGILGDDFEASANALPGASVPLVIVIDKPTTIGELLSGDLVLRRAFTVWKHGSLRFGSWRTPVASEAVAALTEANKAAPAGSEDTNRTAARESEEWVYPIAKIFYDRDPSNVQSETFRGILTVEDSTAVDDAGGEGRTLTLKSRNTFADASRVGASLRDVLGNFVATSPMFTRPQRRLTRSISPKLFEALAVGDTVTIADSSVRDPETGERGIGATAATVIGKRIDRGGSVPDSEAPSDITGTVELFVPNVNPARATAEYAPSADIDEDYDTGDYDAGYNSVTQTIRVHAYRYTDDGTVIAPALSDANYFPTGSVVRIVEIDPADSTAPQAWQTTVTDQTGDDIELDDALTGFDNTKRYRVYFAPYDDATSTQRAKVFSADETDALVQDLAQAYQYASWPSGTNTFLTNMNSTIGVELPPDETYADGAPRDTGTEQAIVRALDAFVDYDSGLSLPFIDNVITNEHESGTWLLMQLIPVQLTEEILGSDVWRELGVSPWFRSSDGSSVQLRITLTRTKPSGSTTVDVNRGSIIATATWTTTSTTWDDGTRIQTDMRVKDSLGRAWLLVEGTLGCETRGVNTAIEGPRLFDNTWWIPT